MLQRIEKMMAEHPKYHLEAYSFVLSALHHAMKKVSPPRHITGKEFCQGIREYAVHEFGPMTQSVLNHWGVEETLDFGCIVFALVEAGLMRKTEEDSLDDFKNVYQFDEAFRATISLDDDESQ